MVRKYCAVICLFFNFISVDCLYAQSASKPVNQQPLRGMVSPDRAEALMLALGKYAE